MPNISNLSRLEAAEYRQKNTAFPNRLFWYISTQSLTLKVSILSRHLYKAVAILLLNTLIVFGCFELASSRLLKNTGQRLNSGASKNSG
jgi:hypothetical protein